MVRSFDAAPVADAVVDELIDLARRAPSAGNTQPLDFVVLTGEETGTYWEVSLGDRRATFRWQGLLAAPVLVLPYVRPLAYVERYGEQDKAQTPLGADEAAWEVPYWWVDGGAAVENLLVAAQAAGLLLGRDPAAVARDWDTTAGPAYEAVAPDDEALDRLTRTLADADPLLRRH
jgi:nitroreductase